MTDIDAEPTTSIPCPDWCDAGAGHPFECQTHGGILIRHHTRSVVVPVASRAREDQAEIGFVGGAVVRISQAEIAADDDGPVLAIGGLTVNIWGIEGGDDLTGAEARQIAAEVLSSADEVDRIAEGLVT